MHFADWTDVFFRNTFDQSLFHVSKIKVQEIDTTPCLWRLLAFLACLPKLFEDVRFFLQNVWNISAKDLKKDFYPCLYYHILWKCQLSQLSIPYSKKKILLDVFGCIRNPHLIFFFGDGYRNVPSGSIICDRGWKHEGLEGKVVVRRHILKTRNSEVTSGEVTKSTKMKIKSLFGLGTDLQQKIHGRFLRVRP